MQDDDEEDEEGGEDDGEPRLAPRGAVVQGEGEDAAVLSIGSDPSSAIPVQTRSLKRSALTTSELAEVITYHVSRMMPHNLSSLNPPLDPRQEQSPDSRVSTDHPRSIVLRP